MRWAVGDANGRRSSTYRLWSNKKGDFYLAVRSLGGLLKTSLHRYGRCHTGWTSDYAKTNDIAARHMDRWIISLDRMAKAVQVIVAEEDLAAYSSNDKDSMHWLRAPKPGHIALVGILVLPTKDIHELDNSWPGAQHGTELVGVLGTSTRTAFAVHWENPLEANQADALKELRERVIADARQQGVQPQPGIRAVLIGEINDGKAAAKSLIDIASTCG